MSLQETRSDLAAVFICSFHDTAGQTLDSRSLVVDGVSLEGIEFAALPSGLHLVDEDIYYFAHHSGHFCIVSFVNKKTLDTTDGGRGRNMFCVGCLIKTPQTGLPSFHHASFVRDAARGLAEKPDDVTSIQAHFDAHRLSPAASSSLLSMGEEAGLGPFTSNPFQGAGGKPLRLLGQETLLIADHSEPFHPLNKLPVYLEIFGPLAPTVYRHALANQRILFYSRPPLRKACDLAWATWAIGRTSAAGGSIVDRRDDGGEAEFLGVVGLMDMSRLEILNKAQKGWVACTTDAIFRERPHLYDLLIDLSDSTLKLRTSSHPFKSSSSNSSGSESSTTRLLSTPHPTDRPLNERLVALTAPPPPSISANDKSTAWLSRQTSPTTSLWDAWWWSCAFCLNLLITLPMVATSGTSRQQLGLRAGVIRLADDDGDDSDKTAGTQADDHDALGRADNDFRTSDSLEEDRAAALPLAILHAFHQNTHLLSQSLRERIRLQRDTLPVSSVSATAIGSPSPVRLGPADLLSVGLSLSACDIAVARRLVSGPREVVTVDVPGRGWLGAALGFFGIGA